MRPADDCPFPHGRVSVDPGPAATPDLVLTDPADAAVGLLAKRIDASDARSGASRWRGMSALSAASVLRWERPSGNPDLATASERTES